VIRDAAAQSEPEISFTHAVRLARSVLTTLAGRATRPELGTTRLSLRVPIVEIACRAGETHGGRSFAHATKP
jgi:hypothetical protein